LLPSASIRLSKPFEPSTYVSIRKKQRLRRIVGATALVALLLWQKPAFASSELLMTAPLDSSTAAAVSSTTTLLSPSLELLLTCRLWFAAALGALIGKERASSNHPAAGVRTMALVSLGAAAFTLTSMYGFVGRYDTSRMASNIASGVGFVGAGVITTTSRNDETLVHGLTTAAAIWLSAAVGVASGCGCYILALTASALTVGILRIGSVKQVIKAAAPKVLYYRKRKMNIGHTTTGKSGSTDRTAVKGKAAAKSDDSIPVKGAVYQQKRVEEQEETRSRSQVQQQQQPKTLKISNLDKPRKVEEDCLLSGEEECLLSDDLFQDDASEISPHERDIAEAQRVILRQIRSEQPCGTRRIVD
jgi:putative Mg2+ transporter-C (MgtC) family protein